MFYESDVSIVRKLLTVRNVKFSQWFRVKGIKIDEEYRISIMENEYAIAWDTMKLCRAKKRRNG